MASTPGRAELRDFTKTYNRGPADLVARQKLAAAVIKDRVAFLGQRRSLETKVDELDRQLSEDSATVRQIDHELGLDRTRVSKLAVRTLELIGVKRSMPVGERAALDAERRALQARMYRYYNTSTGGARLKSDLEAMKLTGPDGKNAELLGRIDDFYDEAAFDYDIWKAVQDKKAELESYKSNPENSGVEHRFAAHGYWTAQPLMPGGRSAFGDKYALYVPHTNGLEIEPFDRSVEYFTEEPRDIHASVVRDYQESVDSEYSAGEDPRFGGGSSFGLIVASGTIEAASGIDVSTETQADGTLYPDGYAERLVEQGDRAYKWARNVEAYEFRLEEVFKSADRVDGHTYPNDIVVSNPAYAAFYVSADRHVRGYVENKGQFGVRDTFELRLERHEDMRADTVVGKNRREGSGGVPGSTIIVTAQDVFTQARQHGLPMICFSGSRAYMVEGFDEDGRMLFGDQVTPAELSGV